MTDIQNHSVAATESIALADAARRIADSADLLEVARRTVEDVLVDLRDGGLFVLRSNGFAIRGRDGSEPVGIRLGPEQGIRIALVAIAEHLTEQEEES